jgi:hypothetical protein
MKQTQRWLGRVLVLGGALASFGCSSHVKLGDEVGGSDASGGEDPSGNGGATSHGGTNDVGGVAVAGGGGLAAGGTTTTGGYGGEVLNNGGYGGYGYGGYGGYTGGSPPVGGESYGGNAAVCDRTTLDDESWIAFDSDRDLDREIYRMHPDGTDLERLTDSVGVDREPVFSPDGSLLAFSSTRSGKLQIHLLELDSGDVSQVTDREEGADQPSFSHDGTRLAFHSGKSVYTIGLDGSEEHLVATGLDDFNAYFWPKFSRDDTHLIFDRNNEINITDLDGAGLRKVVMNWTTTIKAPALSPGGELVAYEVVCANGSSIWTSELAVTTEPCKGTLVTPLYHQAHHPSWGGPTYIAYHIVDNSTNIAQLAVASRQRGMGPCILTDGNADDRNPDWFVPAVP